MTKKRRAIWISAAAVAGLALAIAVSGPMWIPCVSAGSPRNQSIGSGIVEQRITLGMTRQQVVTALGLPRDTMATCARPAKGGGTEVEIVGSSPPWRNLRSGYHTIVLEFDSRGCAVGGRGIWWAATEAESDTDGLQLKRRPD